MSNKAISWAWKQPVADPGAKLVLLFLADCMNGKDSRCHPSIKTIADATSQSERTVQRKLRMLEEAELVTSMRTRSAHGGLIPNSYVLATWRDNDTTPGDTADTTPGDYPVATPPGDTAVSPPGDTVVAAYKDRTGREPSAYCSKDVRAVQSSNGTATLQEEALRTHAHANGHGQANGHAWSNKARLN